MGTSQERQTQSHTKEEAASGAAASVTQYGNGLGPCGRRARR